MMNYSWHGQTYGLGIGSLIGLGILAGIIGLIVLILKGYSLWYAAKRDEKIWFIVLFIVNTVGILELIYLIFIVKKWNLPFVSNTPSTPADSSAPRM